MEPLAPRASVWMPGKRSRYLPHRHMLLLLSLGYICEAQVQPWERGSSPFGICRQIRHGSPDRLALSSNLAHLDFVLHVVGQPHSFLPTIMSAPNSPRLVDSFTAPKEVLQEFADLAEEEDVDPFAETASKRQIAARQSDYRNRRFNRVAVDSGDAFKEGEDGQAGESGYKDAMRLARLEQEEQRVKRAIEEKERQEREEGKMKMDLDKTPPAAELDAVEAERMVTIATS